VILTPLKLIQGTDTQDLLIAEISDTQL